jgi:phosphonate transport system ATP-binding protein
MLSIKNLHKRYGAATAVNGVTVDIPEGQMVGIIGRSGAGKSTLLRLINRLTDASEGGIVCCGEEVTALSGRALRGWRARCAMIFQQFNLVSRLSVVANVLIGRIAYRSTLPTLFNFFSLEERAMAVRALERLDMAANALKRADALSGGQQQRVAIARALVQEPRLVLADEPIASLDPHNATRVMDALRTINREEGITVLTNLHQVGTAKSYCDRILGMAHGRIVFDGPPEALTLTRVQEIYGAGGEDEEVRQALGLPGQSRPEAAGGACLASA